MVCIRNGCCNFGERVNVKKGSKAYSILKMKCPRCHKGDFFVASPYNLRKAGDTFEKCSECDQRYSIEPGFYFGAMYLAYGMAVLTVVVICTLIYLINNKMASGVYIGAVSLVLVCTGPYYYALSKIMWANMFINYQEDATDLKRVKQKEL
jgi:uncharacterized protein (DUF983 family)